ncbi:MAG: hypothetical protein A3J66_00225 [Candidatus Magasanikbacteria bacterium RIFCSPHIGHO2_02_FULL_47_14]|uniref:Glycerophosphoryl diester phosphodiesterase membrane domain-containing protein n=1 Tax=Candidatus Magasanikbacteria bacterium RIFCSPHIGHO2_02_FULL_47_14 TaxID=1798680 RepID=A0A1F6MA98_9BACT|nr:MAG: hypothetical protein A3J66_00225 [Candidatus Magasanikbacteria bacterium RIFCSPHIGHO2_02_FULL_47_14]
MTEPTYRQALAHGLQLVWRHKQLWLLGFFATFLGQVGLTDFIVKFFVVTKQYVAYPLLFQTPRLLKIVGQGFVDMELSADQWLWLTWLGIFFLAAFFMLVFVATASQGALISGISTFIKRPHKGHINTENAWKEGRRHFGRLFFLQILKRVVLWALVTVVGFGLFVAVTTTSRVDHVLFSFLFLLGGLFAVILSFIFLYSAAYVVIEEYGVSEALRASWRLFINHWLVSLEIGFILFLANLIAGAIVGVGMVFFVLELAVVWFFGLFVGGPIFWSIGLLVASAIFVTFVIFLGTLLTTFTTSVWTYLFMKMHKEGIRSRLVHLFRHV